MSKIITVYCAHETDNEYGSIGVRIGAFSDSGTARIAAKGKGFYGTDGTVTTRKAIKDDDGNYYLLDSDKPIDLDGLRDKLRKELRVKALAKLSSAEKEALGL